MNELYNNGYEKNFLCRQNELEVVFSIMTDSELMSLKDRVEQMIKEGVFRQDRFPLSCGGLRHLQSTIMFSFWVRKGKGIKRVNGEDVVCELKESPFWERYQQPEFVEDREVYELDSPEHERDQRPLETVAEEVENDKGEWI